MAAEKQGFDVAIIGGGPAGMSAALWCDELGLASVVIEQDGSLGGQLHRIYNPIENYLGAAAANGTEMLARFEKSLAPRNFARRTGIKAVSIDVSTNTVRTVDGDAAEATISCRAIILATGVRRRTLGIPGEEQFRGKGILESGAREKESIAGRRVLIVGGGDAAFENALILSELAASVQVAYRRESPTARREFIEAVKSRANVELMPMTVVTEIAGNSKVDYVKLDGERGERSNPIDALLIRVGVQPNSELVEGVLRLDESRYIKVDGDGKTEVEHLYAIGDVAHRRSPTLNTATGTAATAVKAIFHSINNPKEL